MYTKIIDIVDFPKSGKYVHCVNGNEILVLEIDGEFYAFDNLCTHEEWGLENGEVDNYEIECELHGGRFCVKTGRATCFPAVDPLSIYPIKSSGGSIYLELPLE